MVALPHRKPTKAGARPSRIMVKAPGDEARGATRARASLERAERRRERQGARHHEERALDHGAHGAHGTHHGTQGARGDLVSLLSHQVRNELNVILMNSQLLSRFISNQANAGAQGTGRSDASQIGRRQVAAITRAAEDIKHILEDFVDAARLEEQGLFAGQELIEPASLVERALEVSRAMAAASSIELSSEIEPALRLVLGDRERLCRALSALVANAIKFTPKGGRVQIEVASSGSKVRFSVNDTGMGIGESDRPFLFLQRLGSRQVMKQGVGVPLFVAKGIVTAHGGQIGVKSEPGQGSSFFFTLPFASAEEIAAAKEAQALV